MKSLFKKTIAVGAMVLFGLSLSYGQSYEKGDNLLNIGVGLGGGIGIPIGISYEHGFSDKISGGVYVGYSGNVGITNWTYMLGAARASYHFDFNVDKLDPYLGAMIGYQYITIDGKSLNDMLPAAMRPNLFLWGGHAGARYLLSEKFGVFAEVGYGLANLNAGVTFKF